MNEGGKSLLIRAARLGERTQNRENRRFKTASTRYIIPERRRSTEGTYIAFRSRKTSARFSDRVLRFTHSLCMTMIHLACQIRHQSTSNARYLARASEDIMTLMTLYDNPTPTPTLRLD